MIKVNQSAFTMKDYLKISLVLCVFGFLKDFRPSESFLTDFLTDFKNVTAEEVNQEIFPVGTYSYLLQLIVVFLITDFLRCVLSIWHDFVTIQFLFKIQAIDNCIGNIWYCNMEHVTMEQWKVQFEIS